MAKTIKYSKMDRRARIITAAVLLLLAGVIFMIWYFWGEGWYITASGVSLLLAILILFILSIPRNLYVGDTAFEIRCIIEITHIQYSKLKSIRKVDRDEMRSRMLLLGSYGFFGYYGYYVDINNWEVIRLYCTQWQDFVEVTDIYEKRYIVNCKEADKLIEEVMAIKDNYR